MPAIDIIAGAQAQPDELYVFDGLYGRDPAEGGLASYHQDHLVSSFGLAALGAADWAASGPAWRARW